MMALKSGFREDTWVSEINIKLLDAYEVADEIWSDSRKSG